MRWYYWVLLVLGAAIIYKVWIAEAGLFADYSVEISNKELREVSGLVASIRNKNMIWVHNDGSRKLKLFLLNKKGKVERRFKLDMETEDFEDIAIDFNRDKPVLYIGDIGDNKGVRKNIRILRIAEPLITDSINQIRADTVYLKYPDGPRDAEALFIDPLSRFLYIITKREEKPHLYKTPLNTMAGDTVSLKLVAKLNLSGTGILKWVTAADVSPDGTQILVRSYGHVFYWKRIPGESIETALKGHPEKISHTSELQGEAIGFRHDGEGFYTLSEGENPQLNFNYIKD